MLVHFNASEVILFYVPSRHVTLQYVYEKAFAIFGYTGYCLRGHWFCDAALRTEISLKFLITSKPI